MNVLLIIILIHIKSGIFIHLINIQKKQTYCILRSLRARNLFFDDTTHDNKGRLQKQSEIF
jgi:hypothetical protein